MARTLKVRTFSTKPRTVKMGHYITGPEPLGCFNTGVAPTIGRSSLAKKYIGKEYVVGKELDVDRLGDNIRLVMKGKKPDVKFYKGKTAAFAEWDWQVAKMVAMNREDMEHVKELKKRAAKGDMKAVLELGDY